MSLDISLFDGNYEVMSMNWLRNPFGLCNWAEDNVCEIGLSKGINVKHSLWHVINTWSYNKSENIDRRAFLNIVKAYWYIIKEIKQGYFFFTLSSYRQFIKPHEESLPGHWIMEIYHIDGSKYTKEKEVLMIPMEHFSHPCFYLSHCSLEDYKRWFDTLGIFALKLQNEKYKFYCSN